MAEYQIEISGPRNEYVFFPPVPNVVNHRGGLRGRWDFAKTAHRDKGEGSWLKEVAFEIQQIPGIVIAVSEEKMKGMIYDPLSLPAGEAVLQKLNDIRKRLDSNFEAQKPWPKVEKKLDVNGLKEWLYWMRRILDREDAVLVSGSAQLPDLETIRKLPGRRKADPFYDGQSLAKTPEDSANFGTANYGLYPWADEVPIDPPGKGKAKEPAGT